MEGGLAVERHYLGFGGTLEDVGELGTGVFRNHANLLKSC